MPASMPALVDAERASMPAPQATNVTEIVPQHIRDVFKRSREETFDFDIDLSSSDEDVCASNPILAGDTTAGGASEPQLIVAHASPAHSVMVPNVAFLGDKDTSYMH